MFLRRPFDRKNHEEPLTKGQRIYAYLMLLPISFFLLAPYFDVYGLLVHGGLIAGFLILVLAYKTWQKTFLNHYLILLLSLMVLPVAISNVLGGVVSAVIPDLRFLGLLFKFTFYFTVGLAIGFMFKFRNFTSGEAFVVSAMWIFFAGLINSTIIVSGFLYPEVKIFFESLLWYDNDMNINYSVHEYRLRGLASAGGASLSVFHSISILAAIWLYMYERIVLWFFLSASLLISTSMVFIGRTGIFLAVLGGGLFVVIHIVRNLMRRRKHGRSYGLILLAVAAFGLVISSEVLLPKNIYNYTVGLLVGGSISLQDEGTISVIGSFYHVPKDLVPLMFGNGGFSGGFDGVNATDAGYMKMLTAAGLFGSVCFYGGFLVFVSLILKGGRHASREYSLVYIVLTLLFVAEVKEPFIIQGYSSRALMLVLGVLAAYSAIQNVRQRSTSTGLQTIGGNGL